MAFIDELRLTMFNHIKKHPTIHFWYRMIKNMILEFGRDGCFHLAAGIAYYGIFSIFPLLIITISIMGYKLGRPEAAARIREIMTGILPGQADMIMSNVETIARDRGSLGILGILILLWTARGLFLAMEYSLNKTWGTPSYRSIIGRNMIAFFLIFTIGIILGISVSASAVIVYVEHLKVPVLNITLHQLAFWGVINKWLISTLLMFTVFLLLFKVLPHTKVKLREIMPGAIFSTICWKIAEFCYIWYMKNMANLSAVYGSIGGMLGILMLFYIASTVFLLGAEFNIVYIRMKYKREIL
ncbi:MAG: YihY/virulence factor BrkB family protein [Firmicutes bacterium]|nr:YihY/virulence factor BrkB family protein [Bacillota bacterium]